MVGSHPGKREIEISDLAEVLAKLGEDECSPPPHSAWGAGLAAAGWGPQRVGVTRGGRGGRGTGRPGREGGGARGTTPSQPTCAQDLKVGGAQGDRFGGQGTGWSPGSHVPNPEMSAGAEMPGAVSRRRGPPAGQVVAAAPRFLLPLLLLLLACGTGTCRVAPILPQGSLPEQELHLWNKVGEACSSFLSSDSQPQASAALNEFCSEVMRILLKLQEQDEKDNSKRFLFHYSKTQKLDNSNVVSSVVHPLLQLVPRLHERRMKRFKVDEAFQNVLPSPRRGYFLFRPRNG
ncbi:neuromedin-U [Dipodomys merriami]|uniref:neuromedin-U n=1 Tax=Dipodomys merriami TaxID=94247 RepID=UPI0038560C1F